MDHGDGEMEKVDCQQVSSTETAQGVVHSNSLLERKRLDNFDLSKIFVLFQKDRSKEVTQLWVKEHRTYRFAMVRLRAQLGLEGSIRAPGTEPTFESKGPITPP